jgi:predicted nucleic acid-binding protein
MNVLTAVFQQVQVPRAVLDECLIRRELPDTERIEAAVAKGWLLQCEGKAIEAAGLGAGERAAIGRALEIGAGLLADDQAARACATRYGLVTIGTLGVLVKAQRLGLVPDLRYQIDRLRASGYWLSEATVRQALAAAKIER